MDVGLGFLALCLTPVIVFICGGLIAAAIELIVESDALVKTKQPRERGLS